MTHMNKKLKTKWVNALRSGRFTQTKYEMYEAGDYCCLGVLCRVAGASTMELVDACMPTDIDRFKNILPGEVANALAEFNDDEDMPFDLIAGFVNETL